MMTGLRIYGYVALSIVVFLSYRTVTEATDHSSCLFSGISPISTVTARPICVWKDPSDGSTWELAAVAAAHAAPFPVDLKPQGLRWIY